MEKKKKDEEQQIALVSSKIVPAGMDLDTFEILLKENMEGLEHPEFPIIKILHAGALLFQLPFDEGEPKQVKGFQAQILLHQRVNAYWEKSYDETGGGVPPNCASLDGISNLVGVDCLNCPHNQFGSEILKDGSKGKGKACKNMMRIFIRIGKDLLPSLLVVPPTSLKAYNAYAVKLTQKAKPLITVLTKFSLESAQNKTGIKYSKLVCVMEEVLDEISIKGGMTLRKMYDVHMKQKPIEATEASPEEPSEE